MARFIITDPQSVTQIFQISSSTVNIGRADSNDLVLDHPSVSRHHARLTVLPGDTTLLIDLGSLNGTHVNGQQIQEHPLADQDRVYVGMFELKYQIAGDADLYVEVAPLPNAEVSGLIAPDSLGTALRLQAEAAAAAPQTTKERLRDLERENKLLKLLLGVGKTLASVLTPDEVMRRVMELVFQMENVERGFVMLRDEERKVFRPAVLLYKNERLKSNPRDVVLSKMIVDRVMTERLPLLILDAASDERFASSVSMRLAGIRSAMCAPLIYKDKVFGLFYVDCIAKAYAFSKEELNIFSVIAAEAAISFDNARSHEELARRIIERQALERFLSPPIVERILANPHQVHLGGENQLATVLFADIRGFTRMSENLDPPRVVDLLNEFFTQMTDLLFENGGTLDKYLGDGIMALFGAPIARVDDIPRAVKTAIEMQCALERLNNVWMARGQTPLRMGIGVNTGQVTAGNIGSTRRMDYTVIGDSVNVAARLCAHAAGGQILISESTFRGLDGIYPYKKLEPIRVKGKELPVETYEILWAEAAPRSTAVPSSA
jgi:adenylate cyclase